MMMEAGTLWRSCLTGCGGKFAITLQGPLWPERARRKFLLRYLARAI